MRKYFMDCEFLEGTQETFLTRNKNTIKVFFIATGIMQLSYMIIDENIYGVIGGVLWLTLGLLFDKNQNKSKPTIDLISIGIVSEGTGCKHDTDNDGNCHIHPKGCNQSREYYAISKDFNLKEAWNRYDLKPDIDNGGMKKVYWIRENVLKPLMQDGRYRYDFPSKEGDKFKGRYDYEDFKYLIAKYGKSNEQIANEVKDFIYHDHFNRVSFTPEREHKILAYKDESTIKFYGYYADYDWVVFCWLFGKMIDLPKGFPMYCIDLKQMLDEKAGWYSDKSIPFQSMNECLNNMKNRRDYPKQINDHNSLSDARWNYELYKFIQKL